MDLKQCKLYVLSIILLAFIVYTLYGPFHTEKIVKAQEALEALDEKSGVQNEVAIFAGGCFWSIK